MLSFFPGLSIFIRCFIKVFYTILVNESGIIGSVVPENYDVIDKNEMKEIIITKFTVELHNGKKQKNRSNVL